MLLNTLHITLLLPVAYGSFAVEVQGASPTPLAFQHHHPHLIYSFALCRTTARLRTRHNLPSPTCQRWRLPLSNSIAGPNSKVIGIPNLISTDYSNIAKACTLLSKLLSDCLQYLQEGGSSNSFNALNGVQRFGVYSNLFEASAHQ